MTLKTKKIEKNIERIKTALSQAKDKMEGKEIPEKKDRNKDRTSRKIAELESKLEQLECKISELSDMDEKTLTPQELAKLHIKLGQLLEAEYQYNIKLERLE